MAFGYEDTDRLYDETICPVLRKKQIEPIRVDRLEHNDEIDNRIIQEIRECDFVIADLTYARPSVYYEAGFAERQSPVIYTIRRDHFTPRSDDPHGRFRVHFDLQMKNVIDWIEAADPSFAARLASRIDHVVAPLIARRASSDAESKEKAAFRELAIHHRMKALLSGSSTTFASCGFTAGSECPRVFGHNGFLSHSGGDNSTYIKIGNGVLTAVKVSLLSDAAKTPHRYVSDTSTEYNLNLASSMGDLRIINDCEIACAFHAVSFLNVCLEMPSFRANSERKILSLAGTMELAQLDPRAVGEVYKTLGTVKLPGLQFMPDWLYFGDVKKGFDVQRVPSGLTSTSGSKAGYRFIYDGFARRAITRNVHYAIIDEIESVALFQRRLRATLDGLADSSG